MCVCVRLNLDNMIHYQSFSIIMEKEKKTVKQTERNVHVLINNNHCANKDVLLRHLHGFLIRSRISRRKKTTKSINHHAMNCLISWRQEDTEWHAEWKRLPWNRIRFRNIRNLIKVCKKAEVKSVVFAFRSGIKFSVLILTSIWFIYPALFMDFIAQNE